MNERWSIDQFGKGGNDAISQDYVPDMKYIDAKLHGHWYPFWVLLGALTNSGWLRKFNFQSKNVNLSNVCDQRCSHNGIVTVPKSEMSQKKTSFFPVVRAVVQVEAWKFQAACRTQKSICMPNIKWIGLEIWKLDKKFYWNFWFQFYAEVRQGLLLTFKGLLEPWYSNPVFNSLKSHLIPNFIKIRPHLAKWEHFEV